MLCSIAPVHILFRAYEQVTVNDFVTFRCIHQYIMVFGHMCNLFLKKIKYFFTILEICTLHFFFAGTQTPLCWMHCLYFCSHHTSAFSHCSGIFRTTWHKWSVCPELTNPIPFPPILFSVYFTHKVLRKQLIPHSSKAPFCLENYKLASIPILIPPSRFAVSQLILIVWVWLNIHFFTAHVRVSTNVITVLNLPYILCGPGMRYWCNHDSAL